MPHLSAGRRNLLALTLTALCAACGTAGTAPSSSGAANTFDDLKASLARKYPEKSNVATPANLPRSMLTPVKPELAYGDARREFKLWCATKQGAVYETAQLANAPASVRVAVTRAEAMYRTESSGDVNNFEALTCDADNRTYVLITSLGNYRTRGFAWVSSHETDVAGAAAEVKLASQRAAERARQAAEEEKAAAAVARREDEINRRRAAALALLANSKVGTQLSCQTTLFTDEQLADTLLECGEHRVAFASFNKYGWRITSQSVTPIPSGTRIPQNLVTLIVEKSR